MKSKLLFIPGVIPYNLAGPLDSPTAVTRLVILDRKLSLGWDQFSGKKFTYESAIEDASTVPNQLTSELSQQLFGEIIADPRTSLIFERCLNRKPWYSLFESWRLIQERIDGMLKFLTKMKPNTVLFQATPHGDWEWILGKTAEFLGIPVYMFKTSPLPWRYYVVKGIDKHEIQPPSANPEGLYDLDESSRVKFEQRLVNEYIEKNQGGYQEALPEYERKRLHERRGVVWSWRKEISDLCRHPSLIKTLPKKYALYKSYSTHSESFKNSADQKKIVLFLHYQPERTSIPEGGLWCQQSSIAKAMSDLLPSGWRLWIKEHPSSFMGRFQPGYRSPAFFNALSKLPNVDLIPLNYDTFQLIDSAIAVATITGTVGVQSLIRGKPVLAFGQASYSNAPGVFTIKTHDDLFSAINSLTNGNKDDRPNIENFIPMYLQSVIMKSVTGRIASDYQNPIVWHSQDVRIRGHVRLFRQLLSQDYGCERENQANDIDDHAV